MHKQTIVFLMAATLVATSGCASKGFVRKNVQTSADALTARIETNEGEMKEIRDNADRKIAGVDSKVSALDTKTTEGFNGLKSEVSNVDQRAGQARTTAEHVPDRSGEPGDHAHRQPTRSKYERSPTTVKIVMAITNV